MTEPRPEVRWITPPYQSDPVPAWRAPDGSWLIASARLVPAGSTTHQLIEAAAPQPDEAAPA